VGVRIFFATKKGVFFWKREGPPEGPPCYFETAESLTRNPALFEEPPKGEKFGATKLGGPLGGVSPPPICLSRKWHFKKGQNWAKEKPLMGAPKKCPKEIEALTQEKLKNSGK